MRPITPADMVPTFAFEVTAVGLAASLAAIVGGAPILTHGLRAWRLRREVGRLAPSELSTGCSGLVLARGVVLPDAALVAPVSGRVCAAWSLEVQGVQSRMAGHAGKRGDFTLESGEVIAEVEAARADWRLPVTATRRLQSGDVLEAPLARAFESNAELAWLRGLGVPLMLTERALLAGSVVHVVGAAETRAAEIEVLRSGTDSSPLEVGGPAMHLVAAEPIERMVVSVDPLDSASLMPPAWRAALAAVGPVLMLAGLAYLLAGLQRGLSGNLG